MRLIDRLETPEKAYSPLPFWFLNGDLKEKEIRRQLRDFAAHGVYGAVLHPRMGLSKRIGYLSDRFFYYIGIALDEAETLGMQMVLYDEGMYPSGAAGGLIVKKDPSLASRGLALTQVPLEGDRILCRTDCGMLCERFTGGTIRGVHFGEDDGEKNAPLSADLLCEDAVRMFIELTHEQYYRRFKRHFGKTVIGFFTDEPTIMGRNVSNMQPWSRDFAELFKARGGQIQNLTDLFTGKENRDTALYRDLILERESTVYYGALSDWCLRHGIALMGHPEKSDDIENEKYFHIPGQDLVYRMVAPEKGGVDGVDSVMGKCAADMAMWTRAKRCSNECFGACGRRSNSWYLPGGDLKWMTDHLASRGCSLFIPHAFYYSVAGKRSSERPPDVGPNSIWWPHYRLWADYMTRLSMLRALTVWHSDIAVLCRNRDMKSEWVKPLFESQKSFDYIPGSLWDEAKSENGCLTLRGRKYRAVLGDEALFPDVPHTVDGIRPICLCEPGQKGLRAVLLRRDSETFWLFTNESTRPISTRVTLCGTWELGQYDLWRNQKYRLDHQKDADAVSFGLDLDVYESLLVFACESKEEYLALPPEPPAVTMGAGPFRETGRDDKLARVTYTATLPPQAEDIVFRFEGEEMAELYANGTLADASFWSPHTLRIPARMLQKGAQLTLVMTGSAANRHGEHIPYGLKNEV